MKKGKIIGFLFYAIFILIALSGCNKNTPNYDIDSFTYEIKPDGNITVALLISNTSKTIRTTNASIDLYNSNHEYIKTVVATSDSNFIGFTINNMIYPNTTKTIKLNAENNDLSVTSVDLKDIAYIYENEPNLIGLWIFLGIFITGIIVLVYFSTRTTKTYTYNGHKIVAATRFLMCYVEVDGKRLASELFLRWGATIDLTYEGFKINAQFRPGFFYPIVTIIINGTTLDEI